MHLSSCDGCKRDLHMSSSSASTEVLTSIYLPSQTIQAVWNEKVNMFQWTYCSFCKDLSCEFWRVKQRWPHTQQCQATGSNLYGLMVVFGACAMLLICYLKPCGYFPQQMITCDPQCKNMPTAWFQRLSSWKHLSNLPVENATATLLPIGSMHGIRYIYLHLLDSYMSL